MEDNLDLKLQLMFLELEKKVHRIKFKAESRIYKFFEGCFQNWRFLVTTQNYDELSRKLDVFITALFHQASNAFLYGSKKKKKEFLLLTFNIQECLNKAHKI